MSTTKNDEAKFEEPVQDNGVDVEPVDLDVLKKESVEPTKKSRKTAGAKPSDKEFKELQEKLEIITKERDTFYADYETAQGQLKDAKEEALRHMAELENFKRRKSQEVDNFKKFAAENVIKEFLPVCDNFSLAAQHANNSDQSVEEVVKGFLLIQQQLDTALSKLDVVTIETEGKVFDPNFHQAISQQEKEGVEANTIIQEVQRGYTLNGKVIRPSMVIVAS
jgi:molecular chaperone GrpE